MKFTTKGKIYLVIAAFLFLFVILGTIYLIKTPVKSNFEELTVSEVQKKIDQKETFFLYIKQDNCPHCEAFTPTFEKVLQKHNVYGYYINLSHVDEKQGAILDSLVPNITGTPTTVFFIDGQESIMERFDGAKTADGLTQKLKNAGYIK